MNSFLGQMTLEHISILLGCSQYTAWELGSRFISAQLAALDYIVRAGCSGRCRSVAEELPMF